MMTDNVSHEKNAHEPGSWYLRGLQIENKCLFRALGGFAGSAQLKREDRTIEEYLWIQDITGRNQDE
jgi:hypothetical protein